MEKLPEEFTLRMRAMLGEEYNAFERALAGDHARGLRLNPLKASKEKFLPLADRAGFSINPVPWAGQGFFYDEASHPGRHPYHAAGVYYMQEPSAMAPADLLALSGGSMDAGLRVLDLCAAPGGKTTQLAGWMMRKGVLVANEIMKDRAQILSQNVERLGIRNAFVISETPEKIAGAFAGYFDRVLVDAPCSGEGMFRRGDGVAALEWSPENVRRCAIRQDGILDAAASCVRPGGFLLYSTCTFAPEEDEGSAARFLLRHPEFHAEEIHRTVGMSPGRPEWLAIHTGSTEAYRTEDPDYPEKVRESVRLAARFFPENAPADGHFMILFAKDGSSAGNLLCSGALCGARERKKKKDVRRRGKDGGADVTDLWRDFCEETFTNPERWTREENLRAVGDRLWFYPDPPLFAETERLLSSFHVLRRGLELGSAVRGRFEPAHALALSLTPEDVRIARDYPADSPEIRAYLHGEAIREDGKNGRGWALVCADGWPLGFAHLAAGTLKNHYPKGLRTKY